MQVLYFPVPVQAAAQQVPQLQNINQLGHLNQMQQLNQLTPMGQQVINFAPVAAPQALQRPAAPQPVPQVAAQPVAVPQQQVAAPTVQAPAAQSTKRVPRQPRVGHSGDRRSGRSPPRNTDWICVSCSNCNWESRKWCKRCGTMKPTNEAVPAVEQPSDNVETEQTTAKSVEMGGNNGSSSSLTSSVGPVSSTQDEVALMTTIAEEDSDDDSEAGEENLFQSQLLELVEAVRISTLEPEESTTPEGDSPFLAMFQKSRKQ
eukprot:TRINITY_DN5825_c1_g1_i1.p1 TRINITY_DN5825_c1_g1~~TRINITY_DN5825_c1_g1_i1.p1  ORF type:complete len:260 (+),score=63.07 TRINITY_DN5825_c1_g1_i1:70-849(+)